MFQRTVPTAAALLAAALTAEPAAAAVHCVANTPQLQQALSLAVSDSGDDEIRLLTGTYPVPTAPPPTGFQYVSSQPGDLTISGGWTSLTFSMPGCDVQVGDPSLTVLDGDYQSTVLRVQPGAATGNITIRNLSLYRGSADNMGGGLLAAPYDFAWQGNLVLQSLRVLANEANNGGAGATIHVPHGYLRLENTVLADNVSGGGTSGVDLVLNGYDSLVANVTVARNSTGTGQFGAGMRVGGSAQVLLLNSVLHGNAPFDLQLAADAARLHRNHYGTRGGVEPLEELATLSGDPMLGSGSLGLTPTPASPLVDAGWAVPGGLPQRDADGGLRIVGGTVEVGAFETQIFADGYEGADDWERPPPQIEP